MMATVQEDMKGKPHLVSLIVNNIPEPRGKIFPLNGKWIFLRNIRRHQIIRIYDGLSVDMALLHYLANAGVDEIHYLLVETGKLYVTTPQAVAKRGLRWGRGDRWQYIMPRRYWNQFDKTYDAPLIPDWQVYVIGPRVDDKTGYGPGTEGGTIFHREV